MGIVEVGNKPSSVLDGHLSSLDVAIKVNRLTRRFIKRATYSSQFSLSPGGVYRTFPITREVVGSYIKP